MAGLKLQKNFDKVMYICYTWHKFKKYQSKENVNIFGQ